MISDHLPAIAFATTKRGTDAIPLYLHTAVLCQQHSEASISAQPNKATLSRAIYNRLYLPIQNEIAKIAGLIDVNPDAAKQRLNLLHRNLINHTTL